MGFTATALLCQFNWHFLCVSTCCYDGYYPLTVSTTISTLVCHHAGDNRMCCYNYKLTMFLKCVHANKYSFTCCSKILCDFIPRPSHYSCSFSITCSLKKRFSALQVTLCMTMHKHSCTHIARYSLHMHIY